MNKIYRLIEKYGKKKAFIILSVAFLTIGILISILINGSQKAFTLDEIKFTYKNRTNDTWIFIDENNEILEAYTDNNQGILDSLDNTLTIKYKDNIIKKENDFEKLNSKIYLNDKLIYNDSMISITFNDLTGNGPQENQKDIFEVALVKEVIKVSDHILSGTIGYMIMMNVFFVLFGASQLIFTEEYWHFKHVLDVEGGKPTEFYIIMTQFVGMIFVGLGLFLPLIMVLIA